MATSDNVSRDDPEQSKRFEEAAREIETDASGEAFERAMGVVVPAAERPASAPQKQTAAGQKRAR